MSAYNYDDKELITFLLTCSRRSLGNFLLSRMSEDEQLAKSLMDKLNRLVDQIIEIRAEVRLATVIRDHGEEIMERLASPPQRSHPDDSPAPMEPQKAAPATLPDVRRPDGRKLLLPPARLRRSPR